MSRNQVGGEKKIKKYLKLTTLKDKRVLNRLMDARVYYEHLKANPS